MSNSESSIKLRDGRVLGYFEYGSPNGAPVFYFHGGGTGSGIYAKSINSQAAKHYIRLISPDRPGIGISDPEKGRSLSDWSDDVMQLADALGISSFSILSQSAGSAYAFSCMQKHPDRILKASIVSGLFPMYDKALMKGIPLSIRLTTGILKKSPDWVIKKMFSGTKSFAEKDPNSLFAKMEKRALPAEREILADQSFREVCLESIMHAFTHGTDPVAADFRICFTDWGFDLTKIKNDIYIWHGEKDSSSPVIIAKRIEKLLPNCRAVFFNDDTHVSVFHRHIDDILTTFNLQ